MVNISASCVNLVRQRRCRTFAAPTATNFRVKYANIHTTYRRRQRIHAIQWLDSTITYLCCAGYVQQRDWPQISCHFGHVPSMFVRSAPGGTLCADAISTKPNHRRHWSKSIFHTSDRRIWRVTSLCEVTACRRPDQTFHFETPFIPLVQHV